MLKIILYDIGKFFSKRGQPYLSILYTALLSMLYFGLFRISELMAGEHPVWASDVHVGSNKNKMMFTLHTSKTHGKGSAPQIVKISSSSSSDKNAKSTEWSLPCPFKLLRQYIQVWGGYKDDNEPFFVFADRSPVKPEHIRLVLRTSLQRQRFDHKLYNTHSLHSGRSCDLYKLGVSTDAIKKAGWWKSNAVYKYLKY